MDCDFLVAQQEASIELSSSALIWQVLMEKAGNNHGSALPRQFHNCRPLQQPNGPWLAARGDCVWLCLCIPHAPQQQIKSKKVKNKINIPCQDLLLRSWLAFIFIITIIIWAACTIVCFHHSNFLCGIGISEQHWSTTGGLEEWLIKHNNLLYVVNILNIFKKPTLSWKSCCFQTDEVWWRAMMFNGLDRELAKMEGKQTYTVAWCPLMYYCEF